jgi:hypothetical protein
MAIFRNTHRDRTLMLCEGNPASNAALVRAQFHHFQPYIKRDLSVRWLREQEASDQRHKQLMRAATVVGVVLAFIGILVALDIIRL